MSITDKLQQLDIIKADIKTAINNKGGNVGDDFTTYATAIENIEGGTGGEGYFEITNNTSFGIYMRSMNEDRVYYDGIEYNKNG